MKKGRKSTFKNPLMAKGADGNYYFMVTRGDRLDLWTSRSMSRIMEGRFKTIWLPPATGLCSRNLWAPEIHHLNGKWYIYFTANDGGGDDTRRIYVLENGNDDPLDGEWTEKGAVNTEFPGLDGSVLEHRGKLIFMYAGYGRFPESEQDLYVTSDFTIEIKLTTKK